jgi:A/G-specific adenine glycosylase
MPWRSTRDPYRIWVSEVMLQQTQVATALPYYKAFLDRFPRLDALARARPDSVLAAWSGLGYYRRARHLHAAARLVVREHGGRVPSDPESFRALPGVGRYTVGAVLSICFDRPLPVLDGNVARVLSRLYALPAAIRDPRGARALWAIATELVPAKEPGDWNQALMELGATVCVPRAPRCGECPVARWCRARARGRVAEFPPVAARRATETLRRAVAVILRDGRLLVTRREGALLDGLWEPPGVELAHGEDAAPALRAELRRLGVLARIERTTRRVRHTITHRAIEVEVWHGALVAPIARSQRMRFVNACARRVPLTALGRKLAKQK